MVLKSTTIKNAGQEFWSSHLVFVGLTARFPRIIAKIMSRYWSCFRTTQSSHGGFGFVSRYTVWKRSMIPDSLPKSACFWMKLWFEGIYQGSCADSFTRSWCVGDIAVSASQSQSSLLDEPTIGLMCRSRTTFVGHTRLIRRKRQLFSWLLMIWVILSNSVIGFLWLIRGKRFLMERLASSRRPLERWRLSFDLTPGQNHLVSHYEGLPDMSIDRQGNTLNIEFR